jgi:hypothetical protein
MLRVPTHKAGPAASVTLEKMTMLRFVFMALLVLLAESCATGGSNRFINGTEIPREKTLVYTSGAQSVTLGAVTATSATFSAPIRLASAVTGVTAATGGDQATGVAIPLTASLFSVGTVGSSGDSVRLPTGAPFGHTVIVENRAATNTLDVFPGASGAVNNKAADALFPVLAGKAYVCASLTAGTAATLWTCAGP